MHSSIDIDLFDTFDHFVIQSVLVVMLRSAGFFWSEKRLVKHFKVPHDAFMDHHSIHFPQ